MTEALAAFAARYGWPARSARRPLCIGHRGASAHANENTLEAFRAAALLGADIWETDARLSRDGVVVLSHDEAVTDTDGRVWSIAAHDAATLTALPLRRGGHVPTLAETIDLAAETGCGLYVEVKARAAARPALAQLAASRVPFAGVGSFDHDTVRDLAAVGEPRFPVAVLVRVGEDPFRAAAETGADIIHLCWERASDEPDRLLDAALFAKAEAAHLTIVLWHEERRAVLDRLVHMPVAGICTDQPELMNVYEPVPSHPIAVVCHRGWNAIAPENTLAGARLCFDQGYWVELDVRQAADGGLAVIHDPTLDRTTDASGLVAARTLAELACVSAGVRRSRFFANERVRPLADFLAAAGSTGSLYIEIKDADVAAVLAAVSAAGLLDRVFFWSPRRDKLETLRAQSRSVRLMSARGAYKTLRAALDDLAPAIIEFDAEADDLAEIAACRQAGARPMIKYFGDDLAVFERIVEAHPDLVNLDRPDIFRKAYAGVTVRSE